MKSNRRRFGEQLSLDVRAIDPSYQPAISISGIRSLRRVWLTGAGLTEGDSGATAEDFHKAWRVIAAISREAA